MTITMNKTLRNILVATAASSLLVAACSGNKDDRQQTKITGELRAPKSNPDLDGMGRPLPDESMLKTPEANPNTRVGSQYKGVPAEQQPKVMATAPSQMSPAQKEEKGMFSWLYADKAQPEAAMPKQRRVPKLNDGPNTSVETQTVVSASYAAAAPVAAMEMGADVPAFEMEENYVLPGMEANVAMHDQSQEEWERVKSEIEQGRTEWSEPQSEVIIAEEMVVMDEHFTPVEMEDTEAYPSLASVPSRPERVDAVGNSRNARMADMQQARMDSQQQNMQLNAQMASDMGGEMPVESGGLYTENEIDAEFAALIANEIPAENDYQEPQYSADYSADYSMDSYGQVLPSDVQPMPAYEAVGGEEVVIMESNRPQQMASLPQNPTMQQTQQAAPYVAPNQQALRRTPTAPSWNANPAPQQEQIVLQEPPMEPVILRQPPMEDPMMMQQQEPVMPTPASLASQQPKNLAMHQPQHSTITPQNEVIVEGEWVSLYEDPAQQMAAPIDEVQVVPTPQVASVSAVPVMPEQNAAGVQLTPPSTYNRATRTLPESRYATRRQAVYMQRYARQVQVDEGY
ncbi:MAG: hypothetical protein MK052_02490 [Alphaproteobacteria bacterium]|nr:hypothetical protein [Alphaproteobacteria bacterium]